MVRLGTRSERIPTLHHGSILMECVLVFPLILLLVSMILQFAHIWMARQMTAYAAFCATRAIMCVPPAEQNAAAQHAAEMVCAWFSFVNLPTAARMRGFDDDYAGTIKEVHVGRLHNGSRISDKEKVSYNDGMPYDQEIMIPGWGGIPGSDSASIRTRTFVINRGYKIDELGVEQPYAAVKVVFRFPLLMPLAGRMLSWFVGHPEEKSMDVEGSHYNLFSGWDGTEVVLDESGKLVSRYGVKWGEDGHFPVMTLTETCVLPMPYSTAKFPTGGYATRLPRGGD